MFTVPTGDKKKYKIETFTSLAVKNCRKEVALGWIIFYIGVLTFILLCLG